MEIRDIWVLRGPNIWANFPCLQARVDLGELKDTSSEMIPGFNDRLMGWLPTLIEHRCSVGERGGFFERLRPRHLPGPHPRARHARAAEPGRHDVGFGRARETDAEGVYKVVIEYRRRRRRRSPALHAGTQAVLAAIHDRPFDVPAEIEQLRELAHDVCLGPSTAAIVAAAKARGIPSLRLNTREPGAARLRGQGSAASAPPRPTAPAPSPSRSPRTRS